MMRSSYLTPYTRAALLSKVGHEKLGDSLLGHLAAGEYSWIQLLVTASGVADPWKGRIDE